MSANKIAFLATWTALACAGQNVNTANVRGTIIRFEWKAEPYAEEFSRSAGGVLVKDDVVKRHIGFLSNHKYFGYDLSLEPQPDGRFRLTFSPLSMAPDLMSRLFKGEWAMLPMPSQPRTQIVSARDVIALDLFENPKTGHKVVDYISVLPNTPSETAATAGPARDLQVDDLEWTIESPKVMVNERPVGQTGSTLAGAPQWLYLKGHGRFVFSLRPRAELGFRKAGEIRGAQLTWAAQGNRYQLLAARNLLPADGVFNLYVFHSPAYRPKHDTSFELGAGGSFESLVRR